MELKEKYIRLFGSEGVTSGVIEEIQEQLGVNLPDDFKVIATFYRGGVLGGISHHAIAVGGPASNIVDETKRLRKKIGLNQTFVVLAEPPNSLIVLDTEPSDGPAVVWCDAQDVVRLDTRDFYMPPDTWDSYYDFFAYLVNEEEDER